MQKFSVTPIGTCRINNPLRQAQARYPICVNTRRVYGFTHTSDEALQQLRYLQGEKTFQERVKPIVMRPESGHNIDAEAWTPSDLNIVEISSAKKITAGDDSVQINYLYRYFTDFFASESRALRFWSLVRRGTSAELLDFLRAEPTFQMLSPEDRSLLSSLRMEQQDFTSVKADMAEIVERLAGSAVLFMTHVNGCTPDGSTIPTRERLIHWVQLAAEQLAVPCFDPTIPMKEFGQERALEQGGLDLTHFSPAFADRVFADIHRKYIASSMEAAGVADGVEDSTARHQLLADNIEALMRFDDFLTGTRRLYAALRKEPHAAPLLQLRGRVLAQVGDFEGAIRDLEERERSSDLSPEGHLALLEAYTETGAWARAVELANGLLGQEYESRILYACAARACEQTGDLETAAAHWKQAFRQDRTDLHAALRTLTLLSQLNKAEQLKAWRDEVLEHSRSSTDGAFEIARWAVENGDEELLAKAFESVCRVDVHQAETLFGEALSRGMFKAAAACLGYLTGLEDRGLVRLRTQAAASSQKAATELLEQKAYSLAYLLSDAVVAVKARGEAVRTRRAAVAHYRSAIRAAYAAQDYEQAVQHWLEVGHLGPDAAATALLAALSFQKVGRSPEALDLLLQIHEWTPEDPSVLRNAGRVAAGLGRYDVALPMYAALTASTDPLAERYRTEAVRFFETAERRALKQVREHILAGDFETALHLAKVLKAHSEDQAALDRELERLNRALRTRMREIEHGTADEADRDLVLRLLLELAPDDPVVLRRAALNAMRKMRFEEAAQFWGRVDQLAPGVESSRRNLEKCRILAARQHKSANTLKSVPVA